MDNLLFAGGLVLSVCAAVFGAAYFFVYKVRFKKLNITLDAEYGKKAESRSPKRNKTI